MWENPPPAGHLQLLSQVSAAGLPATCSAAWPGPQQPEFPPSSLESGLTAWSAATSLRNLHPKLCLASLKKLRLFWKTAKLTDLLDAIYNAFWKTPIFVQSLGHLTSRLEASWRVGFSSKTKQLWQTLDFKATRLWMDMPTLHRPYHLLRRLVANFSENQFLRPWNLKIHNKPWLTQK